VEKGENSSSCSLRDPSNHSNPHNLLNEGDTQLASFNGPISREQINFAAARSTNCKGFVFKMMDGMFTKKEMASSISLAGGVRRYRGRTYTKQALSPNRMKNIFKAAKLRFLVEFARVANCAEFRDAISMKYCKTVFKDGGGSSLNFAFVQTCGCHLRNYVNISFKLVLYFVIHSLAILKKFIIFNSLLS